jgi:hypothetical protein
MATVPINTGRFGKGNPGKPKGATNKTTLAAKEMIAQAADKLGGLDRLVSWAKEDAKNESAFWAGMYPKLLPLQVSGPGPNGEHVFQRIVREVIDPK